MLLTLAMILQDQPVKDEGGGGGGFLQMMPMLILMFLIIYFMMIRPAKRQQREREGMLNAIKKNDKVMTNGGIFGIIHKISEKEVILTIDEKKDVRIRVSRSAIAGVEKISGSGDGEDSKEKAEAETEEAKK